MSKTFNDYLKETGEIGYVQKVVGSVLYVSGLPMSRPGETVIFETGETGQIHVLGEEYVEIFPFSAKAIRIGTRVARMGKELEIPVGEALLGRVIDPLGHKVISLVVDGRTEGTRPIFTTPLGISKRTRIKKPLYTGVAITDLMVPLGKGQRELVIGDSNTGKTSFASQVITFQAKQGTVCIYAAIGKKKTSIKKAQEFFTKEGIADKVIMVVSSSEDAPAEIYITPFSAMTIAEYFRDKGRDVLLVLDDMSTHAKVYRELSLLAGKFPGRESYPGDIFWVHASLLERAGNFIVDRGEASITCLPLVTMSGNIFGYIQTNFISMTDGHIFFDSDLFTKGIRPAINPFLSVTRVGHQTQSALLQDVSRELVSFLSRYERLQGFVRFGAEISVTIKEQLDLGQKLTVFFQQGLFESYESNLQVILVGLLWNKVWDKKEANQVKKEIEDIVKTYQKDKKYKNTVDKILQEAKNWRDFLAACQNNLSFLTKPLGSKNYGNQTASNK